MEKFVKQITRKAGGIILKKFGKIGAKYFKEDAADIVTGADLLSNKFLIDAIQKKYPIHGIISEESKETRPNAEYVWIIDPLDGTRNFATHTPLFCIIVGLARNNRMEMAAVFDPVHDEFFFARNGKGAFLNGKRIHCSAQEEWKNSWGCSGARLTPEKLAISKALLKHVEKESFWISVFGTVGLSAAYVARGRRDWYISSKGGVWDYAAPALLLQEAGCKVSNMQGKPWKLGDREIVAANKYLHQTLLSIINA